MLVTIAEEDDTCQTVSRNHHYGNGSESNENGNENIQREWCRAVTKKGKNLYVTGRVQKRNSDECNDIIFDDVLLFQLKPNGNVLFARRYDIDGSTDIGMSIIFRKKKKKNNILF